MASLFGSEANLSQAVYRQRRCRRTARRAAGLGRARTAISLSASDLALKFFVWRGIMSVDVELDAGDLGVEASDRRIVIASHAGRSRHEKHLQGGSRHRR